MVNDGDQMTDGAQNPGALTRTELYSQPETWAHALERATSTHSWSALLPKPEEKTLVLGCGTSFYIGDAYAYLRTDAGLGRTRAAIPREVNWVDDDEHIIVISRSGTTADVISLVERYRNTHRVTAILGDTNTTLGRLCANRTVHLGFADERSVVQTRFATTGLTVLRHSLGLAPETLVHDAHTALHTALPAHTNTLDHLVFLGHRWTLGLAHEAALKVRESAGFWAESYSVWEYEHGPISCAGPQSLVWFLGELPEATLQRVQATGARTFSSSLDPQAQLPLAHRLAVSLALQAGRDPDRPPHLNRSVLAS